MSLPDLTILPVEEIRAGYSAYSAELSRRHELETAPQRVREICERHCELGGDPQILADEIHTVAVEHEITMKASADGS